MSGNNKSLREIADVFDHMTPWNQSMVILKIWRGVWELSEPSSSTARLTLDVVLAGRAREMWEWQQLVAR